MRPAAHGRHGEVPMAADVHRFFFARHQLLAGDALADPVIELLAARGLRPVWRHDLARTGVGAE